MAHLFGACTSIILPSSTLIFHQFQLKLSFALFLPKTHPPTTHLSAHQPGLAKQYHKLNLQKSTLLVLSVYNVIIDHVFLLVIFVLPCVFIWRKTSSTACMLHLLICFCASQTVRRSLSLRSVSHFSFLTETVMGRSFWLRSSISKPSLASDVRQDIPGILQGMPPTSIVVS